MWRPPQTARSPGAQFLGLVSEVWASCGAEPLNLRRLELHGVGIRCELNQRTPTSWCRRSGELHGIRRENLSYVLRAL